MENRGLLFIPDISGFTKFLNEIEIEHGRHIIQQLLETLINANESGLEISEVEGDAILFYKFGEPMDLDTLYRQVERMFCAFHRHLISYDHRRICQCKACVSAVNLTLKVITHYGEFTTYNVKQFNKLIGKDVIVAHQLLKNDIQQHEYWLVTGSLAQRPPAGPAEWMQWLNSAKQTETGAIPFYYTQLGHLKEEIRPEMPADLELEEKVKMISASRDYEVDIKTVVYTAVHFEFRHLWQVGVKAVDEVEHFLPGIGSRHRHVLDDGRTVMMYTSSFVYDPEEKILFSETDEKRKSSMYYTVEKSGPGSARLTMEFYMQRNPLRQLLFSLTGKKKMESDLRESLERLDGLVQKMELPLEF